MDSRRIRQRNANRVARGKDCNRANRSSEFGNGGLAFEPDFFLSLSQQHIGLGLGRCDELLSPGARFFDSGSDECLGVGARLVEAALHLALSLFDTPLALLRRSQAGFDGRRSLSKDGQQGPKEHAPQDPEKRSEQNDLDDERGVDVCNHGVTPTRRVRLLTGAEQRQSGLSLLTRRREDQDDGKDQPDDRIRFDDAHTDEHRGQ